MTTKISVEVDYNAGAAYIELSDNEIARTVEVNRDIMVDVDEMGVAVGIEVLDLAARVPVTDLCRQFHIHSDVELAVRSVLPSLSGLVATSSFRSGHACASGSLQLC